MDTVDSIFTQARQTARSRFRSRFFPPKGELSMESARTIAQELAKLDPAFISVTYSAGGSGNKQATAEIAAMIQDDHDVPAVAHLTCAAHRSSRFRRYRRHEGPRYPQCACIARRFAGGYEPGDFRYAKDLSRCWRTLAFAWAPPRIPRAISIATRFA